MQDLTNFYQLVQQLIDLNDESVSDSFREDGGRILRHMVHNRHKLNDHKMDDLERMYCWLAEYQQVLYGRTLAIADQIDQTGQLLAIADQIDRTGQLLAILSDRIDELLSTGEFIEFYEPIEA